MPELDKPLVGEAEQVRVTLLCSLSATDESTAVRARIQHIFFLSRVNFQNDTIALGTWLYHRPCCKLTASSVHLSSAIGGARTADATVP